MHTNDDRTRRYTVRQAAELLGITPEAVRARMHRGSLEREKDADGTVHVLLSPEQLHTENKSPDQSALVEALQDQVTYLREQLDGANDANREMRRLLAALTQRIPELPASSSPEPREPPESATQSDVRATDHATTAEPQRAAQTPTGSRPQPQSLWRRIFG